MVEININKSCLSLLKEQTIRMCRREQGREWKRKKNRESGTLTFYEATAFNF